MPKLLKTAVCEIDAAEVEALVESVIRSLPVQFHRTGAPTLDVQVFQNFVYVAVGVPVSPGAKCDEATSSDFVKADPNAS